MGTRGAIGFRQDGELKVCYNHYDSYPNGLGDQFLEFVKIHCSTPEVLASLKEHVKMIQLVEEDIPPTEEQFEDLRRYYNGSVGDGEGWYSLLRGVQGVIGLYEIANGCLHFMIDAKGFLRNSLFCEYAYIIDLDKDTANFYKGFNKNEPKTEFGITSGLDSSVGKKTDGYYPVRTVAAIPFKLIEDYENATQIFGNDEEEE